MIYEKFSPQEIYTELNKRATGQHKAKRLLANTFFMHYIKALRSVSEEVKYGPKSNIMLVGPTGCGKTYLVKQLADIFPEVPFLFVDATSLTKEGYYGDSLGDVIGPWAKKNPTSKQIGVVFIDEIDKLCANKDSNISDWHTSIQHNLLKLIEGSDIYDTDSKSYEKGSIICNTENMLFIFGGNFESVRKLMSKTEVKSSIGFVNNSDESTQVSMHEEFMNIGMIQELIGRISSICEVEKFNREELKKLLLNKEHGMYENYRDLFRVAETELDLSNHYINKILDICEASKTGARGLQTALDEIIAELVFDIKPLDLTKEEPEIENLP